MRSSRCAWAAAAKAKKLSPSWVPVPYRGGAPLNQDMLAGQIDFGFSQAASTFVHVRNGNLKVYPVMAKTRGRVSV